MSFASLDFGIFAVLFYLLYALFGFRRPALYMALFSLFFYGWWDFRYLPLLIASAIVDFYAGKAIHKSQSKRVRKLWLLGSVTLNIGALVFFKYWNFFATEVQRTASLDIFVHDLILPLGLSFYTLQTLGYSIDVYRRKLEPEQNFLTYLLFVSFFPQLIAGPIERAGKLLPQLKALKNITFSNFRAGFLIALWGLFIKLAVADNIGGFVQDAFSTTSAGFLFWGVCVTAMFQVYCDFYAYTLIARGLAKGIGVSLSENFRQPFFAKNLTEFWQRWHITLTRWILDYVHIPLARRYRWEPMRSLVAIGAMCLVGLWHGASWNFILFGVFHGVVLRLWTPTSRLLRRTVHNETVAAISSRVVLIAVLSLSAPMFLIQDMDQVLTVIQGLFSFESGWETLKPAPNKVRYIWGCVLAIFVITNDILIRRDSSIQVEQVATGPMGRAILYGCILITMIVLFGNLEGFEFVYFQF